MFRGLVILVVTGLASAAQAQCTKDTDCKGERVCEAGQCVAPHGTTPPPAAGTTADAPPPPPAPPPPEAYRGTPSYAEKPMMTRPRHWAGAAGVIGLVGTTFVAAFSVGAAFTTDLTSVGLGAGAILTAALTGVLVTIGAGSARVTGVRGLPGARIAGWILYALAMVTGAAMVVVGLVLTFPSPVILAVAALGCTGLILFSADAFASAAEANQLPAPEPRARRSGPSVVPVLSAVKTTAGSLAPSVGLAVAW